MKLTVKQLKKLIKEAVNKTLKESLETNKLSDDMHEAWPGTGTDRLENFADSMSDEEYIDYIKGRKEHNKWLTAKNASSSPISQVAPNASKNPGSFKEEVDNVIDEGSKESAKAQIKLLRYLEKDGWRIDVKNHVINAKPPSKLDPQKQIVVTMHAAHGKGAGDTFADYRRIGKLYGVNKDVMMTAVENDAPIDATLKENGFIAAQNEQHMDMFDGMLDGLEQRLTDDKIMYEKQMNHFVSIKRLLDSGDVFSAAYQYEKHFGGSLTPDEKQTLHAIYKEFG